MIKVDYCMLPSSPNRPYLIYSRSYQTLNYNIYIYRNPTHSQRPPFSKISATLNASSSTLLQWTGDDRSVAGQLGGQLSEAQFLYQELQKTYS